MMQQNHGQNALDASCHALHNIAGKIFVWNAGVHFSFHCGHMRGCVRQLRNAAVAPFVGACIVPGAPDAGHLSKPRSQQHDLTLSHRRGQLRLSVWWRCPDIEQKLRLI